MLPVNKNDAVTAVIDPQLSVDARRRLEYKINNPPGTGWLIFGGFGGMVSFIFLIVTFIAVFTSDLGWWAPSGSFISLIICLGVFAVGASSELNEKDRTHLVSEDKLDAGCAALLLRAQSAIRTVVASDVYSDDLLGPNVNEEMLRMHEWEIAVALREITGLSATLENNTKIGSPGPKTAAVLSSHRRALTIAREATIGRIEALERFATQVTAADNAKRDWKRSMEVSNFNSRYRDLVARTAADKIAIVEITGMTEQAAAAAQVFNDSLHEASLAAEALVLPQES
jgi:hypothetical protein